MSANPDLRIATFRVEHLFVEHSELGLGRQWRRDQGVVGVDVDRRAGLLRPVVTPDPAE